MEEKKILDERYVLTSVQRRGGMSFVAKGVDLTTGKPVAIKSWLESYDLERARQSLVREAKALNELQHTNIVKFHEFIRDEGGRDYLILEWLEDSLHDRIKEHGDMSWNDFYSHIGRPVLEAIAFAHRRRWAHRDISPGNILFSEDGTPRIIDYGISKQTAAGEEWNPISGKTFFDARTHGYSPPEPPIGIEAYRRDCFSIAAVACYSVSGVEILNDDDLRIAFEAADLPNAVREIFSRAISHDPDMRFPMGGSLLEQIDEAEHARRITSRTKYKLAVSSIESVRRRLSILIGDSGGADVESFLIRELNEDPFCLLPESEETQSRVDAVSAFEVYSPEWRFRIAVAGVDRNRLEIVDIVKVGQTAIQSLRDQYLAISVTFVPTKFAQRIEDTQTLGAFLGELLTETQERLAKTDEERIRSLLGAWRSLVREQSAAAAAREWAVQYETRAITGDRVTFNCDESLTNEILGQRRFVRGDKGRVFGQIVSVSDKSLVLEILRGDPQSIGLRGTLEVDTNAAERAASTQIRAIDQVQYGDTANPNLSKLVAKPNEATPPVPKTLVWDKDDPLDSSLRAVVEESIGTKDLYVIEGPPGTGKTTIIANIISRYLGQHPQATILLASQTHIAVDNVLEKLSSRLDKDLIIRIGQKEDQRIDATSRRMLLSRRVEAWAARVNSRAQSYLRTWAKDHGVDVQNVEAGIWIERILSCRAQLKMLSNQERSIETRAAQEGEKIQSKQPGHLQSVDNVSIESEAALTDARSAVKAVEQAELEARKKLREIGGDASLLADSNDDSELSDWSNMYLSANSDAELCRKRIELLEGWFQRLGRGQDFYIPMITEANVIAATCVAIGGVRGIEQVQFDLCIVDEASKATAPEALIPMALSKKWILVGDPRQLPPFFDRSGPDEVATELEDEARRTILDRFLDPISGTKSSNRRRLEMQFRMVRPIGDLISNVFYDGWLQSVKETHGWSIMPTIPAPVCWYSTTSADNRFERRYGSHSFQNLLEAKIVKSALDQIQVVAKRLNRTITVAVIAGYIGQVRLLEDTCKQHVTDWPGLSVSCNSVDSFQGREADVCVYSVTRSNPAGRLGFLREKPRLNVALSRGQSGLIIIGDHVFCRNANGENPFEPVISYIESNANDCAVVTQW